MTTLSLSIDPTNESSISGAISVLQRLLGKDSAATPTTSAKSRGAVQQGGETGNAAPASGPAAGATTASSNTPATSPAVTFDALKKAFLGLSTKPNGRPLCESVLKPLGLAKLSEAKEAQYGELLAAIEKAAA